MFPPRPPPSRRGNGAAKPRWRSRVIRSVERHEERVTKFGRMLSLVGASALLAGCVLALPAYNEPSHQRIAVDTPSPEQYAVRIDVEGATAIQVPATGRLVVDVPRLPRECSRYFLGIKVSDGNPDARKAIHFLRDGKIVRKLSLADLARLPIDPEGWRIVRLR
jgi:hypothetical protein